MRKAIAVLLGFAMLFSSFFVMLDMNVEGKEVAPVPLFAGGDGTIGNPYQISNIYELQDMNSDVTDHYSLINDIDASATSFWAGGFDPVGAAIDPFSGTLDGQGFNITDMVIDRPAENEVGLFGFILGEVSNLTLVNSNVTGTSYVGSIVGWNDGAITNVTNHGDVTGSGQNVGGIAGLATNCITNVTNHGNVTGSGQNVGGITGYTNSKITNCYSTGNVANLGGNDRVGGVVGNNNGIITNCYSTGNVTGTSNYIGGLVGINGNTITNCYSTGSASGPGANVGGFCGDGAAGITGSFWDTDTSGNPTSSGGTGKTTTEMMDMGTFVGASWDFDNIWAMKHSFTYPYFARDHVNTDPVANNDSYTVPEDTVLNIPADGVLANDTDIDVSMHPAIYRGVLSVTLFDDPSVQGAPVTVNADGSYNYDPTSSAILQALAVGEYIIDTFTYTVIDGNGGTDAGTVSINVTGVNDAPTIITSDVLEVIAGQAYYVDYDAIDIDTSDILTWSQNSNASWFTIDTVTGIINAIPVNADAGTYWVNISVDDGNGGIDSANFTLEVLMDTDGDTDPDITDSDDDNDGVPDTSDDFPLNHAEDTDTDLDGIGNNADTDDDNDGVPDTSDDFPLDSSESNDTDNDGIGDNADADDDNDGVLDVSDDFPLNHAEDTDTDLDGTGNNADTDDDEDGWLDTVEELAGSDPLDDLSMPGDADSDGTADFMDPDFLTVTEYNNATVYDNQTVYNNNTVWNNATADLDADSDGWNDITEILAGTDPEDDTDMPSDADSDGIADFMDSDFLATEVEVPVPVYNNNTIWNNGTADPQTVTETPIWAWGAVIAAIVMGVLAVIGFGRKPESKHPDEREEFEKEDDMDLKEKEDDEEGTTSYAETQTPYDRLG